MEDEQQDVDRRSLISRAIQEVLERHGVPERQRLGTLGTASALSYAQVRRRMTGETPWNVDEIRRVADHFGEPLFGLLASLIDDLGRPANLLLGGICLPCSIWTGAPVMLNAGSGPLVAVPDETGDHWTVLPIAEAGDRKAYFIRRLLFEGAPARRVAVVVDDESLALEICRFLRGKALDAVAYRRAGPLRAALESARFDGFIVDWKLDGSTSRELLADLRAKSPGAPVIVLADPLKPGSAGEQELATALSTCRAQLYEKPTGMLSLLNALELGFAAAIAQV